MQLRSVNFHRHVSVGGWRQCSDAGRFGKPFSIVKSLVKSTERRSKTGLANPGRVRVSPRADIQPRPPPRRQRLARYLLSLPARVDTFFDGKPVRRATWCFIAFGAGYYCANTVSLTFGTLAVNDVVAAIATLIFYEVVSYYYYSTPVPSFKLELLNYFKNGVVAGFLADCFKLGG